MYIICGIVASVKFLHLRFESYYNIIRLIRTLKSKPALDSRVELDYKLKLGLNLSISYFFSQFLSLCIFLCLFLMVFSFVFHASSKAFDLSN